MIDIELCRHDHTNYEVWLESLDRFELFRGTIWSEMSIFELLLTTKDYKDFKYGSNWGLIQK
jgi:hypothetical protein